MNLIAGIELGVDNLGLSIELGHSIAVSHAGDLVAEGVAGAEE